MKEFKNNHNQSSFERRKGVDGLRGIASILVILFHANTPGFSNGYAGVDIFFVISGFVITSVMLKEFSVEKKVDLLKFYARRSKRLLPMSLLVLISTAILFTLIASPLKIIEARSVFLWASMYGANWELIRKSSDYWSSTDRNPVQHYWSLSVEEQFYFVWPLAFSAIMFVKSWRIRFSILLISMSISLIWLRSTSNVMFSYMATFCRVYQLMMGSLVSFTMSHAQQQQQQHQQRNQPQDSLDELESQANQPSSSAIMISSTSTNSVNVSSSNPIFKQLCSFLSDSSFVLLVLCSTSFSGEETAAFYIGLVSSSLTLVLLISLELTSESWTNDLLCHKWSQLLGNYSYGIYLVHWPLVVLGDIAGILPAISNWVPRLFILITFSIGIAALLHYAVEKPVAQKIQISTRQQQIILSVGGLCASFFTALLLSGILRQSSSAEQIYAQLNGAHTNVHFHTNTTTSAATTTKPTEHVIVGNTPTVDLTTSTPSKINELVCENGPLMVGSEERCFDLDDVCTDPKPDPPKPNSKGTIFLIGDSYVGMWTNAFNKIGEARNMHVTRTSTDGCTFSCTRLDPEFNRGACCEVRSRGLEYAMKYKPEIIVLSTGMFAQYDLFLGPRSNATHMGPENPRYSQEVEIGFKAYVSELRKRYEGSGKEPAIFFIEPPLATSGKMADCVAEGKSIDSCSERGYELPRNNITRPIFRKAAEEMKFFSVDIREIVCPLGICPAMYEGSITYGNWNHISGGYSALIWKELDQLLQQSTKQDSCFKNILPPI